jgi:hypothetical protein
MQILRIIAHCYEYSDKFRSLYNTMNGPTSLLNTYLKTNKLLVFDFIRRVLKQNVEYTISFQKDHSSLLYTIIEEVLSNQEHQQVNELLYILFLLLQRNDELTSSVLTKYPNLVSEIVNRQYQTNINGIAFIVWIYEWTLKHDNEHYKKYFQDQIESNSDHFLNNHVTIMTEWKSIRANYFDADSVSKSLLAISNILLQSTKETQIMFLHMNDSACLLTLISCLESKYFLIINNNCINSIIFRY